MIPIWMVGKPKRQDNVRPLPPSLAHAEAREHTIEHVVGGYHADQVVERPQRGAQVGRGSRGVHTALPRALKRLDLRERPLQRLAVARPGDDRLHVAEREQAAKRHLGELATQLGEALPGHDRNDGDGGRGLGDG